MAKKDIAETINNIDPDSINWSDPNAYAAMGVGAPDDEEGADATPEGDSTASAPASAAPATPAPAAAPAAAATPAPAPEQSSETPAAAPTAGETARPEGVATRDGKHVIPYAVLEQTREQLRAAERANADLQQQLAQAAQRADPNGSSELAQRAQADPNSLTDEELETLAADYPALVKPLQMLQRMREQMASLTNGTAAPAAATAAPSAPAPAAQPRIQDEEFDLAIAANPLIGQWMGNPQGREWNRARALDRELSRDPAYANVPLAERFAKVQRMVAAEFDVPLPNAAPSPSPAPAAAPTPAAAAKQQAAAPAVPQPKDTTAFPTLSDMGGTAPVSEEDQWTRETSTDLLAKAEQMSERDLLRLAGIGY